MPPERPDSSADDQNLAILSSINWSSVSSSVPPSATEEGHHLQDASDKTSPGLKHQQRQHHQSVNQIRVSMFDEENMTKNAKADACLDRFFRGGKNEDDIKISYLPGNAIDYTENRASPGPDTPDESGAASRMSMARQRFKSTGSIVAHTLAYSKTGSIVGQNVHQPKKMKKQAPTYRMEPLPGQRINYCLIKDVMSQVTDHALLNMRVYEPMAARKLIKQISHGVVQRIKLMQCGRYKIVCHVTVMELTGQSVMVASRHLWNEETDKTATIRRGKRGDKGPFEMIVTVYGVYHE